MNAFAEESTLSTQPQHTGTLMWIGQRDDAEFRPVFAFCESQSAQLAWRSSLHDAASRPARDVACIVITRQTRTEHSPKQLQQICDAYPDATLIQILGSLCEGERPRNTDPFGPHTIYWYQWNQFLTSWLANCGAIQTTDSRSVARSVAIVAESMSSADPLMDLAASVGTAAYWCRTPSAHVARNFDVIWWDDSVARAASTAVWQRRIETITSRSNHPTHHVWMTHCPRAQDRQAALRGGIDILLNKPYRIESLLQTICPQQPQCDQAASQPNAHSFAPVRAA
ncbi:MAG: hypothetical protein HKN47_12720 [Pirellulaceae bacterium]|nr:hypothetical protein [Pirellulaceae bacterium]